MVEFLIEGREKQKVFENFHHSNGKKLYMCKYQKNTHKIFPIWTNRASEKNMFKFIIRKNFFSAFFLILSWTRRKNTQQIGCDFGEKFAEGNVNIFPGKYYEEKNRTASKKAEKFSLLLLFFLFGLKVENSSGEGISFFISWLWEVFLIDWSFNAFF